MNFKIDVEYLGKETTLTVDFPDELLTDEEYGDGSPDWTPSTAEDWNNDKVSEHFLEHVNLKIDRGTYYHVYGEGPVRKEK